MADQMGVLICGELAEGRLASITTELLGAARRLASALGRPAGAVFLGSHVSPAVEEAIAFGADQVYVVDNPLLQDYHTDPYVVAMEAACRRLAPDIVLLGQTALGRDLAPRLAFRLETGLAMDCIDLAIDPDSKLLLQTRPVYGGSAMAQVICPRSRPQMATVRAKSQSALERDASRRGSVAPLEVNIAPAQVRTKFLQRVKEEATGVKLEEAEAVVSGGRGIGGAEGFRQLEELAKLLGGAVGATRAAIDSGWWPSSAQIGLTGKIVAPSLYIAVALSGSSQHLAGCSGSKNIVAINKDPEANIFKAAQFGVVGDYKKVIPPLMEKVKELLAG